MSEIKPIEGGVCAPLGFKAGSIYCGIKKSSTKNDLSLIVSEVPANAAGVYTTNLVKGAPIIVCREHLKSGLAQAIIANSGNANTAAAGGVELANKMCALTAEKLGIDEKLVLVASTGVIGQKLDIAPIEAKIGELGDNIGNKSEEAAIGIMTTDTVLKQVALSFEVGTKRCAIGGIAKGSGMIHPNMATMLVFITTDCAISSEMLQKALSGDIQSTFNMLSVDGDTSTNDTVLILANGKAGNNLISSEGEDFNTFMKALNSLNMELCKKIASDGEGATKLINCKVSGADSLASAKTAAKSVICSSLVKTAMFGSDANWGRVICALGYSGVRLNPNKVDISFSSKAGKICVCEKGAGVDFSEDEAKEILSEDEIDILVDLNDGEHEALAWGCDLTYDYVKINGDYRT